MEKLKMVSREKKRTLSRLAVLGFFLCLCSALCGIPAVDATLIWSDTFTGTLPPDWTVLEGSFTCTNDRLETQTGVWHAVYTPSTVGALGTEGEWRFDVHYETVAGMWVAFMAADTNGVGDDRPDDGYGIWISRYDNAIRLARHVSGTESYMGYYPMTASNDYSLIVTRDSSGEFNVWIDGTLRITATNTAVTTSVYFLVVIIDPGNYIDNIQVYDEILTVSGGNGGDGNGGGLVFPPELIAIIGGAVAIIVIIAVVILILRRRKAGL
ncbi:MAG: hypothetical protein Q6361_01515 [Candidatus Hermodarchaeota archaeon]|nr:hypothetical protein [Candidatus Hermodarchaeota archaeon]